MSWRERYRMASFRGVPFRTGTAGEAVGRRLARHEYPLRDLPWMEDLGRRARSFRLEGWVVGEDYDQQRDRLIEAAEQEGSGELVHPTRGRMLVVCEGLEVREETREGGLARLSFLFVEAGRPEAPDAADDAGGLLELANGRLRLAADGSLGGKLNVAGMPGFVLGAIRDAADRISQYLRGLQLDGPSGLVSRTISSLTGLADRVLDIAGDPDSLSSELGGVIRNIPQAITSRREAVRGLLGLYKVENPAFPGLGLQDAAHENGAAIVDFSAEIGLGEAIVLAGEIEYESLDDALALRGEIAGVIDGLGLREDISDAEWAALEGLRTALYGAVPPPDEDLPRLAEFTPARTLPSLVLAYGLWDDRERAGEIVERNALRRPGFVPGGQPLEVLSA